MGEQKLLFEELFSGLPRLAPGGDEFTRRALGLVELPPNPTIVDVGCGLGKSTLVLARECGGQVIGVDSHEPYLAELVARAGREGLRERVRAECADMADLPFPPASIDLLWAEGAIYIIGFERGLQLWRPLLKPGAWIAVTELSWVTQEVPASIRNFWEKTYPAMRTVDANLRALERSGYAPVDWFVLPDQAWEREYYRPLEKRLGAFERKHADNSQAAAIAAAVRTEIDTYRASAGSYSYVFYVARVAR